MLDNVPGCQAPKETRKRVNTSSAWAQWSLTASVLVLAVFSVSVKAEELLPPTPCYNGLCAAVLDGGDGQEYSQGVFAMLDWGEAEPTKGNDLGIARFLQMLDWFDEGNCASTTFGKKQAIFSIRGRTFGSVEAGVRAAAAPLEHRDDLRAWTAANTPDLWRATVPIWDDKNPASIAFKETLARFANALANHPRHEGVMGPESAIGAGIDEVDPTFTTEAYFQAIRDEMDLILDRMPNTIGYSGHNFYGAGTLAVQTARRDQFVTHAVNSGRMGWFYPDPFSIEGRFDAPTTLSLQYLAETPETIPSIAGGQNPRCSRYRTAEEYFTAYAEQNWTPANCSIGNCAPRPSHILVRAQPSCISPGVYDEATIIREIKARAGKNSMSDVCPSAIGNCSS